MKNVNITVKGNILTATIDLSKTFGLSKSEKTTIVASTGGNQTVEGHEGIRIGINVFKPNKG